MAPPSRMFLYEWTQVGGLTDSADFQDGSIIRVVAATLEEAVTAAEGATIPGILGGRDPTSVVELAETVGPSVTVIPSFTPAP